MQNPIYYELFGPDDPAPLPAKPAESPLESDLFDFQSSAGAAELLSLELQADDVAERMLGGEISKLTQGLSTEAVRPPISTSTFKQEPLPVPEQDDETGVRLCECACPQCRRSQCAQCSAATKCPFNRREDAAKAVAGMVGELRGRLYPRGRDVPTTMWKRLEDSMSSCVTKAIAAAI